MKYLAIIVLFSVSFTPSFAQIEKGTVLAGIQGGGYSKDSFQDQFFYKNNWGYSTTLAFGKATSKNVVTGFQLSYQHSKFDDRWNIFSYENFELSAGFYQRYYHQITKGLYIWLQGGLNYTHLWQNGLHGASWGMGYPRDYRGDMVNIVAYPGLSYSINKNIQLEASYRDLLSLYAMKRTEYIDVLVNSQKIRITDQGFSANKSLPLAWQLGVRVLIYKKKK